MFKRLANSKTKLLAVIFCFVLSVSMLFTGAFMLTNKTASADEVAAVTAEFKAEAGAAIRYNTETPGIRFVASVNQEQYNAWAETYGTEEGYTFKMYIQVEGLKGQDGAIVGGESGIGYYAGIPSEGDITKWDFAKGDFKFGGAIYLETAWADSTAKTAAEIYNMYAEAEFSVAHLEAYYGATKIATGDVTADTARTIRSVATALFVEEMGENTDIQLGYLVNEFGNPSIVNNSSLKYFYDRAADTLKVPAGEITGTEGFTFRLGAKDVTANVTVADGYITLSGVKAFVTAGETYSFNVDNGAGIESYNNIIGATEIIYTADRMKELFKLSKGEELFTEDKKVTESVTVDGTTYSATFYNDKIDNPEWFRGYYVLGNDIDYGYTANNSSGFIHDASIFRNTSYNGVNSTEASGLFGFGGTFDGNGYAIKNASFDCVTNSIRAQGLFGALAYGATVKNVALTNVVRSGQEAHRAVHFIATFTGGSKEANDYLTAKYGTTDTVLISDVYVQISDSKAYGTYKKNPFNQDTDGTYLGEYDFYNIKQEKNDTTDDGVYYASGAFGLTYQADANYMSMQNVVLDMPNSGMTPFNDNYYVGFYTDPNAEDAAAAIDNSVLISANSTDKYAAGKIQAVRLRQPAVIWDEESSSVKSCNPFSRSYSVYDLVLGGDLHIETLAANDYAALVEAGVITSGSNKINMTFVDGEMTYNAVDDAHSANTTVYAASGINRYDSLTAMAATETSTDLTAYCATYWDTTSGAPVWRSGDNKGFDATIDTSYMVTVGTEITVTSTMGSEDVTASTQIGVQNAEVLSVSGNKITATATGTSMISVVYYDGTMKQEYIKFITIDVINAVTDKIYLSADASKIAGSETEWSTPYVANANGKDYDKTDLTALYKTATGSEDATITDVYQVVMGKNNKLATTTDDDGNLSVAFDAEGKLTDTLLMVYGSNGIIYFTDVSIVTAVLSEAADYLYVNTTATTRAGYYVIANDFDAIASGKSNNQYNNLLNTATSTSNTLAFSFGGWDTEIEKPTNAWTGGSENGYYSAFVGTIDGLGHTLNNVETRREGLLGTYTDQYQTATLKNVQFTNLKSTYASWVGKYTTAGKKILSFDEYYEQILARLDYKSGERFVDTNLITLENVVISMDKDKTHYRDNSQYGTNLKLAEDQLYYNVVTKDDGSTTTSSLDGGTRWSFIFLNCRGSNNNYYDMGVKRINFVNTVLEYKINDGAGLWSVNYGGQNVIAHKDEAAGGQIDNIMAYICAGLDGLTLIVEKTHSGRVASAFYGHCSADYSYDLICLAKNDFEKLFPDATNGKTASYYYMGYASEEDTSEWIYSTNAEDVGKHITISGKSTYRFFTKDFYRYDNVSDAINSGVTRIGNYEVTAEGFVWSPAN